MSETSGPAPALVGASAWRRSLRLGLVIAVLVAEFAFVMWTYHLDDVVGERRVHVAQAQALRSTLQAGVDPRVVDGEIDDAVTALLADDAPGAPAIAEAARGDLGSPAGLAAFASAVQDTSDLVAAQQRSRDWLVRAIIFGLFLVVCAGWFAWFGRLAGRHRAVQAELTRHEMRVVGERRLQALVRNSVDVIAVLEPDSTTSFISPSVSVVLGRTPDEVVGQRFVDLVMPEDRVLLARLLARTEGDEQALSLRMPHPDGRLLSVEGTLKDLQDDPAVLGWVLTVRDVTEKRALEQDLAHQAFHDALTGLANRQLFADRLGHAMQRREETRTPLSLLFVDLDDFKLVNDSLGHHVGDQILVVVAQRIEAVLGSGDTAARLGGDEFAILLDGSDVTEASLVAQRLLAAFEHPVAVGEELHRVRASIGLATVARGAETDPHLMRNADVARYDAKDRGKGGVAIYDPHMHTRALEQLQMRIDLADAITHGQLLLHFQPTVSLATQTVSGFEALVRWQHPERGIVPPLDFIPLAEESGLIVSLGAWVLREACRAGACMQHEGEGPTMAVNVAVHQLSDPGFRTSVIEALDASGLPADRLVLEITESVLLDGDADGGVSVLSDLRELGVRVAIDDFGTGYSSLAQLSLLPVDVLKVDKSFIDRLGGAAADSSLVDAILAMCDALDLVSVAEGVEDADQARWLRDHHASLGQGFLWSRPVVLQEALDLLHDGVRTIDQVDVGPVAVTS
ncbi:MAG: EAL domain-containing protein [Nocardioides sp.]|nr:EAL domain-containing protein [Nocardioides sp.]